MTLLRSFAPVVKKNCRVLVLGSMPGVASLQQQQYYAHPRNVFWPIMEELFGIEQSSDYDEHCNRLTGSGLGIWDVLKACKRTGSLDSSIEADSEQANDFMQLFLNYTDIQAVFFNGGAAERLYKRHVLHSEMIQQYDLYYHRLPSTSPAFASMHYEEKLNQWRRMIDYLT